MHAEQSERQQRASVAYQFELQADKLGLVLESKQTNYRYGVHDRYRDAHVRAVILMQSFDFYTYRLNRGVTAADVLIVQRHNAVVPLRVVELDSGQEYGPGSIPAIERTERIRRTHEEVNLFVSMLLVGIESAYQELARMPRPTRGRYLALRERYLRPVVGRRWVS